MVLSSWLPISPDSDFSLDNLPLGIFSPGNSADSSSPSGTSTIRPSPRAATRLGDTVIDLAVLQEAGYFDDIIDLSVNVFDQPTLNAFIEHPSHVWREFRKRLIQLFRLEGTEELILPRIQNNEGLQQACFHPVDQVQMHLPIEVREYTDFYSSRDHAVNVGTMYRGKDQALQPNWLHLPVGYHGRASTIVVSGNNVRRPWGQLQKDPTDPHQGSIHAPCQRLDFELEVAVIVGGPSGPTPLTMEQAKDRLFGWVLMNDWSARDVQKWEYVPLGPFTAKNFATTISPWIVMADALEPWTAPTSTGVQNDPQPLPYLQDPQYSSYDIELTGDLQTAKQAEPTTLVRSNLRHLYWNAAQQLVHHTVTGCVMRAGDLLGSGTISGPQADSFGSLLELSWNGTRPVPVGDQGEVRTFLEDGDTVIIKGFGEKPGHGRVGFGECRGKILPAWTASELQDLPPLDSNSPVNRYSDFVLYGYWRSSSTWRVRIGLEAKKMTYRSVFIDISKGDNHTADFLQKSPLGQIPVLEFTDAARNGEKVYLSQSIAILEFLDMAFPTKRSLIPKDPVTKALAMELVELINSGIQPLQNTLFVKRLEEVSEGRIRGEDHCKYVIERGLKAFEALVHRHSLHQSNGGGPYCLGTFSPTVVEAFLVPQVYNARRFGVQVEDVAPAVAAIDSRCADHPWFRNSHPQVQGDAPQGS